MSYNVKFKYELQLNKKLNRLQSKEKSLRNKLSKIGPKDSEFDQLISKINEVSVDIRTVKSRLENLRTKAYLPPCIEITQIKL